MKRFLQNVALFLVLAPFCYAGDYDSRDFRGLRLGVNAGVNFSNASIDPDITANGGTKSGRTDVVAGLVADYKPCSNFSIRTEANYMQYGYRFENTQTVGTQTFTQREDYKVNYLEIPVMARQSFNEGELTFAAFFGPLFGFRFCAQEDFSVTFGGSSQTGEQDIREQTSKFHFGLTGGVGADYSLGNRASAYADVRYTLGLSNVYMKPGNFTPPPNFVEPSIKYRSVNIHVGLLYQF